MTRSPIVDLQTETPIARVRMLDAKAGNPFTPALIDGVVEALNRVGKDQTARVVILEGLTTHFCTGASADRMLGPRNARIEQTWRLLTAVFDCPVPVIAAAQGNAYGGGLLLALCCDATVLNEQSRYAANFLMYGFTPIGGATHLIPETMGPALGNEMLYTGRTYLGSELSARGAGPAVTKHDQVLAEAQNLAVRFACAPRRSLELLKSTLVSPRRAAAEVALKNETAPHEESVGDRQIRMRVRQSIRGQSPLPTEGPWDGI